MMDAGILSKGGIALDKGVARFLDDRALYESVLVAFLDDTTFAQAEKAFAAKDYKALFMHIHTLKGASGTMDMTDLFKATCDLTDMMRGVEHPDEAAVARGFDQLKEAYSRVRSAILEAKEE